MGSICDMNNATRAAAVLAKDPEYLAYYRQFVGATITGIGMMVNEPIGSIAVVFTITMPDGTEKTLDGPQLREVSDSGILGMDLNDLYEDPEELRGLMTAAAEDPDNKLDDQDRAMIREELEELDNYY